MSGHSKWAQIKRQKGSADVKRGQMFTKLANAIMIGVRQGGGITDPEGNFKLRLAIDRARASNMPKENIERAISRAAGKQGGDIEEVVYEGFAPGGAAVLVEAVTDNKQRTTGEIKNVFDKNGGNLATPGAVSYQFQQNGLITINKNATSVDDILLFAADAGAEDVEEAGQTVLVYTNPSELKKIEESLSQKGLKVDSAELIRKPTSVLSISNADEARKVLSLMEKIDGLDDVQKVYSNFDIPEVLLTETISVEDKGSA